MECLNEQKRLNIVCFGNCNMLWNGGFISGLKKSGHKVYSFAHSNTHALSQIYHIKRLKNKTLIDNADLIILAIGEIGAEEYAYSFNIRHYTWLYQELYFTQKTIIVILWHYANMYTKKYYDFHLYQCSKFGFNLLDAYKFCKKEKILDFFLNYSDFGHPLFTIEETLALKICHHIELFKKPKCNVSINDRINFFVYDVDAKYDSCVSRNHLYNENILRIDSGNCFKFPKTCDSKVLLGIHTWNDGMKSKGHSVLVFENSKYQFAKFILSWETFSEIYINDFEIDNNTLIHGKFNSNFIEKQFFWRNWEYNDITGVIGFLLCDRYDIFNLDSSNSDIIAMEEYDFSFIFNFLKEYKSIIEQYNQRQDPIKLAPLQNQIKEKDNIISTLNQEKTMLQNELNSFPIKKQNLEIKNLEQDLKNKELQSCVLKKELGNKFVKNININYIDKNSAKSRIQNHLSYKLGQALIANSKSILGYIRMPFVLSYIKDKHKFEQKAYEEKIKENPNLALPPLEAYPDYKEALKEKECFTYKLGEAFIKASKNWYGGGVYQIYTLGFI
ncbi:hypothetical protein ACI3V6_001341 [Campylobacter jejuni]